MVFEILSTTPFGREKKGEVGVDRLVEEGGFSACYPLHDVSIWLFVQYFITCKDIGTQDYKVFKIRVLLSILALMFLTQT